MEIRIVYSGLCLFVPQEEPPQVHVLFPATDSIGIERHHAVLVFDSAHLTAGSQAPSGVLSVVPITNRALVAGGGSGAETKICDEVVNLSPVTGRPIPDDLLDGELAPEIVARISMTAGAMTAVAAGACWEWDPGQTRRLAHRAEWTIHSGGTQLDLNPAAAEGEVEVEDAESRIPILFPTTGNDRITLLAFHVRPSELPPEPDAPDEPSPGDQPHHFYAYYPVFRSLVTVRLPSFGSLAGPCGPHACPEIIDEGTSSLSCMLARVDLQ
jgi:hypothetical protein